VRARALRPPVFLGSFPTLKGALRAPHPLQLCCSTQKKKINYFHKQNASLQASNSGRQGLFPLG
jgi:hypothetical protein